MKIVLEHKHKEYCEFAKNEIEFLFECANRYVNAYSLEIDMVGEYISGTFEGAADMEDILNRLSTCAEVIERPTNPESSRYTIIVKQFGDT